MATTICIKKASNTGVYKAIKTCFDEIAQNSFFSDVRKVLIKPNWVNSSHADSGVTTDLLMVSSLIEVLKERGVEEVWVGESSLRNTQEVFDSLDVCQLEKFGASIINFDENQWVKVTSPLPLVLDRFYVPETVLDCDLIISAAKMKTHCLTGATLSVKNFLGLVTRRDRRVGHKTDINKAIVEIYAYFLKSKKILAFIDGMYALEGKLGPTTGTPVKMDLVIAGNDAVAADATCVEIMGYNASKIRHLALSEKLGLGEIKDRKIAGEQVRSIRRIFDMPSEEPITSNLIPYLKKLFKRKPYLRYEEKCIRCGICANACPRECITIKEGSFRINYDMCISCLVCCESCLQGALDYEISHSSIYKNLKLLENTYSKLKQTLIGDGNGQ